MVPLGLIFLISSNCPCSHCKLCRAVNDSFTVGCEVSQPGELDCPPQITAHRTSLSMSCSAALANVLPLLLTSLGLVHFSFSKISLPCLKLLCPLGYVSMKSTSFISGDLCLLNSSYKKSTYQLVAPRYSVCVQGVLVAMWKGAAQEL